MVKELELESGEQTLVTICDYDGPVTQNASVGQNKLLAEADCFILCVPVDDFDGLILAQRTLQLTKEINKLAFSVIAVTKCDKRNDLADY